VINGVEVSTVRAGRPYPDRAAGLFLVRAC
jgi:hypothetical protein